MYLFICQAFHREAFTLALEFTSIFACEGMAGQLSRRQNLGLRV